MTVLELVVVLGVVAGATAMAAAAMPKLPSGEVSAGDRLVAFVKDVRLEAMRSGQPLLLEIGQGSARASKRQINWAVSDLRVLAGGQPVREFRAIVSNNGIIAGAELSFEAGGESLVVPGAYRRAKR